MSVTNVECLCGMSVTMSVTRLPVWNSQPNSQPNRPLAGKYILCLVKLGASRRMTSASADDSREMPGIFATGMAVMLLLPLLLVLLVARSCFQRAQRAHVGRCYVVIAYF